MKKTLYASLAILALVSIALYGSLHGHAQQGGVGGSAFHKNDITYSTEVVTPHVPWATKLPGGPVKGFFITPIRHGRDMVELMQRLALDPTTVSIDPAWDVNCWGIGDYYGHETRGDRNTSAVSFPANRDGWVRVTKDSGLQFDFLSSEQLEKGSLASGRYKVLILPLSMAVSPAEVKAIEAFVRNGGAVITDAAAGMMNEHCAWRQGGLLNELFGISTPASDKRGLKRAGGEVTVTADGTKWGLDAKNLAGLTAAEAGVRAAGGAALLRIGAADAIIARRVGRGWAIYLNTLFDHYPMLRGKQFGGGAHRALVNILLDRAGIRPEIEIQSADGRRILHPCLCEESAIGERIWVGRTPFGFERPGWRVHRARHGRCERRNSRSQGQIEVNCPVRFETSFHQPAALMRTKQNDRRFRSQTIRSNRCFCRAPLGTGAHFALRSIFTFACFLVNEPAIKSFR